MFKEALAFSTSPCSAMYENWTEILLMTQKTRFVEIQVDIVFNSGTGSYSAHVLTGFIIGAHKHVLTDVL